ncbi:TlpA disulfide reductase family protein [Bacillaceae bacterium IKA-2]|jgi:thiol-disulfide isomerase/thioredoxin|nr:TlpA disulfide reductase family protein [Bacillaceae bacterium IKA-2]
MKAPNFTLEQMKKDQQVSLNSFSGKPIMLTFWASWCPNSQKDLLVKEQFYRSLPNDNLIFLTINVTGREEDANDGIKWMEDQGYTFPVLLDKGTKTYDTYQCMSVPTTVLINKDHEIAAKFTEKAKLPEILKHLGEIL